MCANKCCLYEHAFKYLLFFKILEINGYKNLEIIGHKTWRQLENQLRFVIEILTRHFMFENMEMRYLKKKSKDNGVIIF